MLKTSSSFRDESRDAGASISLSEVISALSYALDLTEGAVQGHGLRSCLMGMRIAGEIGLAAEQRNSLYFALLLKDIAGSGADLKAGVQEDWSRWRKPNRVAWKLAGHPMLPEGGATERIRQMLGIGTPQATGGVISVRLDRGANIVSKLGMGELAAEAVRFVDEHWDGSGQPDSLRGEEIPLLARICAVAQHLDIGAGVWGRQGAIDRLVERSGTWFDPELVRVAVSLDRSGELWKYCTVDDDQEATRRAVLDFDPGRREHLKAGEIDLICEAFADVVDAKSHFTFSHSMGVADAALGIAKSVGLSPDRVQIVRRAALLHDIGKLSVSNSILDKTGHLNAREWRSVRQHPGYTRRILERVGPFREIAVIASEHHEKLDGSGYPNRLMAPDLSMEARIIAVADVYGALSEDRPYRMGMEFDQIVPIMKNLALCKLDSNCVEALLAGISSQSEMAYSPVTRSMSSPMIYAAI